jgi:hypothetical protein
LVQKKRLLRMQYEINSLRQRISEFDAENMKLRQELKIQIEKNKTDASANLMLELRNWNRSR